MAKLKMTWIKEKKAPLFVASGLCLVLAAGLGTGLWLASEKEEEVTYREVQAEYGELTVGLEESGNVTVGTTEQTFDLDLSAYTGSSSDGFSWGQGGGIFQGMGGQSGAGSSGSSGSSSTRNLIIEEVLITEGQEIAQGDALYRITQESMDSIREELCSDVSEAEVTLAKTQDVYKRQMLGNTKLFYTDFSCDEIYDNSDIPAYKNLAVYNDDFMYAVRHFLKSDEGSLLPALGSLRKNPRQTGVINYVTNYSGFTLADLVSYDRKHNEDNGEENRDGENYNVSWNCGFEGRTRKKSVQELRGRQMKNAMLLLLTSQGTPMIVSGDEFGFSHGGNNNPYCQDNGVSWLNWRLQETNQEFFSFVKQAIAYRKKHPVLHRPDELAMMDYIACGYLDLSYHGEEAWKLKADNLSRQAGLMYCGCYAKTDRKNDDNFIYIAYNMHWEEHDFALPSLPAGLKWTRVLDTAAKENGVQDENGKTAAVKGRSVQILESREKTEKEKQKAGRKKK